MRRPLPSSVVLMALIALLGGYVLQPPTALLAAGCEVTAPIPGEERFPTEQRAALHVVRQLPLETKLGQLLMMGFVGTQPDAGLLDRARRGHVGGFFLLGRNVRDAAQVRDLTSQLAAAAAEGSAGVLPFVATDFEGGTVNALRAITGGTPSASTLAGGGVAGVEARGAQDAATLTSLGFNVNLAPVADVLSTGSEVIGSRAFSSDAAVASALSRAYLRGLQKGNVIGVLKHFPGHGATSGDSHLLLPQVSRSRPQLEASDLQPYQQAIAGGEAQAVMVGHLLVPALDPEYPTSLSPATIAGLLRDRLRFDGVVMTDELKMGAIAGRYTPTQAALMAVLAGVDVILADYTRAEQDVVLQSLVRACLAGQLPAGRIEQSAARILRLKLAHGLAGPDITSRYAAQLRALGGPAAGVIAGRAGVTPAASAAPTARPPDLGGTALPPQPDGAAGRWYGEGTGSPTGKDDHQGEREGGREGAPSWGFAIADSGSMSFWESYATLGGPARLGYPISQRFELNGATVQATQRAVLRWDPERLVAAPVNVLELLDRTGALLGWPGCSNASPATVAPGSDLRSVPAVRPAGEKTDGEKTDGEKTDGEKTDGESTDECSVSAWLQERGIPAAIPDDGSGGDFRRAVATRLGWLEHETLRAAYLADPAGGPAAPWPGEAALATGLEGTAGDEIPWAAIERLGLPMSRAERRGPFLAQRFQRGVLQLWLEEVPGMPAPGSVTPVLVGELLREAGLIPAPALVPQTLDGTPGAAPDAGVWRPPSPPVPAAPASPVAAPAGSPPMATTPTATAVSTPASVQPTPTRPAVSTPTVTPGPAAATSPAVTASPVPTGATSPTASPSSSPTPRR